MDKTIDYCRLHLKWIAQNPKFSDSQSFSGVSYYDSMQHLWYSKNFENEDMRQFTAYRWLKHDIDTLANYDKEINRLKSNEDLQPFAFITIGYNEQTINPTRMKDLGQKVALLKYFSKVQYVHEKHRENGIHHHTHFLCYLHSPLPKSKIIQYVWQISGIQKFVLGKQFIDVKTNKDGTLERFQKYINLDKTESKLKYIEMDEKWRKENNL